MTMAPELILPFGALFLAIALATGYVIVDVLHRRAPARQRLYEARTATGFTTNLPLAVDQLDPRLARANRFLPKSPKDMSRLQKRMARAGYRGATPVIVYSAIELALPVTLMLVCIFFLGATRGLFIGAPLAIVG